MSPSVVSDFLRRRAGTVLSDDRHLDRRPWFYLSDFYEHCDHERIAARPRELHPPAGRATAALRAVISRCLPDNAILCCEPVLGTDPRSVSYKNIDWSPDARYAALCQYYRAVWGLRDVVPTHCTLRTDLTGIGRVWADTDRLFMFGLKPPNHSQPEQVIPRSLAAALE